MAPLISVRLQSRLRKVLQSLPTGDFPTIVKLVEANLQHLVQGYWLDGEGMPLADATFDAELHGLLESTFGDSTAELFETECLEFVGNWRSFEREHGADGDGVRKYHLAALTFSIIHFREILVEMLADLEAASHRPTPGDQHLPLSRHLTKGNDLDLVEYPVNRIAKLPAPDEPGRPPEAPVAVSESGRVKLYGELDLPEVDGRKVDRLTPAQYRAVKTLLEAGESGLCKDQLEAKCEGDPRKVLRNLRDKPGSPWVEVISFPGSTGGGYRIL